jgi:hypothetical protein
LARQSVYRSQKPVIEARARDDDLVLVHLDKDRDDLDTRGFWEVWNYSASTDAADLSAFDHLLEHHDRLTAAGGSVRARP